MMMDEIIFELSQVHEYNEYINAGNYDKANEVKMNVIKGMN